ncbi:hypothetical protein SELMODRAFT_424895 [Selaginella moellendorffii]|uniref:Uncharacterized protein n=1 Tax=Selaginella moellendorffii TaxID=88036 RepID=D8SRC6_SELML|nr:hypothetical protein SELMODRAFT_424895 [Selaginella moellendorffii]
MPPGNPDWLLLDGLLKLLRLGINGTWSSDVPPAPTLSFATWLSSGLSADYFAPQGGVSVAVCLAAAEDLGVEGFLLIWYCYIAFQSSLIRSSRLTAAAAATVSTRRLTTAAGKFTKEKPKQVDFFAIENPFNRVQERYEIIRTHRPGEEEGLLVDRRCKQRGHWERHCKGPGVDPFAHEQKKCYLCLAKGHDTYHCSRDPLRNEDWAERTYTGPWSSGLYHFEDYIVQVADFRQYHPRFCVQRIKYENVKRICKKHPDLGIFIVRKPPRPLAVLIWECFQRLDGVLYEASLGFEIQGRSAR